MPRRAAPAIVLATLAAAALAACSNQPGDPAQSPVPPEASPSPAASTPPGSPKQAYVAQGDAICGEIDALRGTIPVPPEDTDAALAGYFQQLQDVTRPKVDQFRALQPPEADRAVADELNRLFGELLAANDGLIAAYRQEDPDAIRAADDAREAVTERLEAVAAGYGFVVCSS
ncbi:MAG: hypothetical protein ACRDJO_06495 [Actinomycetota bacterium]